MATPRTTPSRAYKRVAYTGGNFSLTATAITAVHATALDIVLAAQVGDQIEYGISALYGNEAQFAGFDVYTVIAGAPVNSLGPGLSASLAAATGVSGWYMTAPASFDRLSGSVVGPALVAGDIDAKGEVTLRLYYAKSNATPQTLRANTLQPLHVFAKNIGPADPY